MKSKTYDKLIEPLEVELVQMARWAKAKGERILVLFEGRDTAGKGGAIKAVSERLNPRQCRVVALPKPSENEQGQWYFQRYARHLPAAGEIVLFDRSWYNRAGVEPVMGFASDQQVQNFLRAAPIFEKMLVDDGIRLFKYWLSCDQAHQEERFAERLDDPLKRWKLSPMDMAARSKWVDYSRAKDAMFEFSDTPDSPWYVVDADDKYCARLNVITHFLARIPYKDLTPEPIELPPRQKAGKYERPPIDSQKWIPRIYPHHEKPTEGEPGDIVTLGVGSPKKLGKKKNGKKDKKKDKKK